jgi:hypothetical protein
VLALSAAALTPGITRGAFAALATGVALWGLVRGVRSIVGIGALKGTEGAPHWTDLWFYGVFPSFLYVALAGVAVGLWSGQGWAVHGIAAVTTAVLLLSIRNEWDLVTWLAPKADERSSTE